MILLGGSLAPIIPSEMTLLYSYQTTPQAVAEDMAVYDLSQVATSAPIVLPKPPLLSDDDGNGKISVSVFADKAGNKVYIQIPDEQYTRMGKANAVTEGINANPKKDEYLNVFEALATPVEAAITYDSSTASADANATSVTWSHANAGDLLVVGANLQAGNTITSVAFNGSNITQLVASDGDAGSLGFYGYNYLYYKASPTVTTANVVVSSSVSGWMRGNSASYSGTDTTGPIDTSGSNNEVTSNNEVSLTVSATGAWVVSWCIFDNSTSAHISPQAGITSRSEGTAGIGDSNGTVSTGSSILGWQTTQGSQRSTCLNAAIKPPQATATGEPFMIIFE